MNGKWKKQQLRNSVKLRSKVDKIIQQQFRAIRGFRSYDEKVSGIVPSEIPSIIYYLNKKTNQRITLKELKEIRSKVETIVFAKTKDQLLIYLLDPDRTIREVAEKKVKELASEGDK